MLKETATQKTVNDVLGKPQDSRHSGDPLSLRGTSGERGSFFADEMVVQGWQAVPSPRPSPHSFGMGRGRSDARARALPAFLVNPTAWTAGSILGLLCFLFPGSLTGADTPAQENATVIIVVGAAGQEEFGKSFSDWAALWEKAGVQAGARIITIGAKAVEGASDYERLRQTLETEAKTSVNELWLVLIGHGTFDGKEAKFNLIGPDVSATELAGWLQAFHRPMAVINTSSSSSPFINKLSAEGRVVITATRSGHEQNFARFGKYLAEAVTDPQADLDKDGQTSLLEAFLFASRRMGEFYQLEGRLATEHPLVDDNGDGLGTPSDWFRGIRAVKKAKDGASLDGLRAHQFHLLRNDSERNLPSAVRAKRDELELGIGKLRESKSEMEEEAYYRRLETLLLEMAHLYESVPAR